MSDAFDLGQAARDAPATIALVDEEGELDYRALAGAVRARADRLRLDPTSEPALLTPELDRASVIAILARLELRAPIVLAHPRWSAEERARALERITPWPERPTSPAVVVFTSGTSGRPKGVCLSRGALLAAARAHGEALPWAPDERWMLAMPLAHVGGLSVVLRCLAARRTIVLGPPRFDPDRLLDRARHHRVTLLSLVPTMLARLLPRSPPEGVRAVLLGGAACPRRLLEKGRAAGWPLLPTYGLSECCAQVCTQRLDDPRLDGVGPPLPGVEVRVRGGQIEVRGPTRMDGFLGEPPLPPEAWYATGDAGRLDADGHLHVLGRLDERIVTGGENVDPLAVEEALRAHPLVCDACVVGVDDPEWGQRVAALIVRADERLTDDALSEHLAARVASFARPRVCRFVDALPETGAGKIDRRAARRAFER